MFFYLKKMTTVFSFRSQLYESTRKPKHYGRDPVIRILNFLPTVTIQTEPLFRLHFVFGDPSSARPGPPNPRFSVFPRRSTVNTFQLGKQNI